jgi:hypothetical protein
MRLVLILLILLAVFPSCKEGYTDYQMRLLVRNSTDKSMTVQVFPKARYVKAGKYSYSDTHTKLKDTAFIPDSKLGTDLFSTDTVDMDPIKLTIRVFDSIHIRLSTGKVLRFSPQKTVNFSLNPFTDKDAWMFQKNDMEYVRMWRDNNVETNDYIFIISGVK